MGLDDKQQPAASVMRLTFLFDPPVFMSPRGDRIMFLLTVGLVAIIKDFGVYFLYPVVISR